MPRHQHAKVFLALSPAALAAAFCIRPCEVYGAIALGHLEVKILPGTIARRIFIADAEKWYREFWISAKPRTTKRKRTAQ